MSCLIAGNTGIPCIPISAKSPDGLEAFLMLAGVSGLHGLVKASDTTSTVSSKNGVSTTILFEVSALLSQKLGLHFPPDRFRDLARGLREAAADVKLPVEKFARWFVAAQLTEPMLDTLAARLTVGETYFFRHPKIFEAIEQRISQTEQGFGRLRVWSAGCSSGEEPYSVAISCRKILGDAADCRVSILGSDINPVFLAKASTGVFGEWSFRDVPASVRHTYFKKTAAGWEVAPQVKRLVRFERINLAEASDEVSTESFDIIFCRNVLMYFSAMHVQRAIDRLYHCLAPGGWLVLAPCEASFASFAPFVSAGIDDVPIFEKLRRQERPLQLVDERSAVLPGSAQEVQHIPESAGQKPSSSDELLHSAAELANRGERVAALRQIDAVMAEEKLNPDLHYLRANILQELGNITEAAFAFRRVIYLDPNFVLAHFSLGILAQVQSKTTEANKHFENALALAQQRRPEEVLSKDGVTAGRLVAILQTLQGKPLMEVNA